MSYLDPSFKPDIKFWNAFYIQNKCPICDWGLNGGTYTWQLLSGPVDCACNRCGSEWSHAIPLGPCEQRRNILDLMASLKRFYALRDELNGIIAKLHGN